MYYQKKKGHIDKKLNEPPCLKSAFFTSGYSKSTYSQVVRFRAFKYDFSLVNWRVNLKKRECEESLGGLNFGPFSCKM